MSREPPVRPRTDGELLRGVTDNVSAMLAYWDADQRCRFANRAYERWFGVRPETLIGKHISDLLGPVLYQLNKPYLDGVLRGEPQEFEREIPDPRGGPARHSLAHYIPDIVDGVVQGFYVLVSDISEIKRAQLALARSELEQTVLAETGTLLASSLDVKKTLAMISELIIRHVAEMCIVDLFEDEAKLERLAVAHADPGKAELAEALARYPLDPAHTIGARAWETKQPDLVDDITPEFIEARAQDAEHKRLLLALGVRSAAVVPMLTCDKIVGMLILVSERPHRYGPRDITLLTEIARRATLAIENARLYEAAQRATRARDEVLGIVAHDVRSPLHSIRLTAELLQRRLVKIGEERGKEHVASILRSVERANTLIQDLLDVTRIEAGTLALSRDTVAPASMLGELVHAQQHILDDAALELRVALEDSLPDVHADRHRMLQVLENLVGNAVKFTPKGGCITIAASAREREVLFSVSDTGAGIAAEHLPHVFDRFYQVNRTERRGAGLGLPICKGIVESHGGTMWIDSTPGLGTTCYFTLPRAGASRTSERVIALDPQWKAEHLDSTAD